MSKEISLNNGSEGNPALPTRAVLMAGVLSDPKKSCSIGFKAKGDIILLLGLTRNEIGCTEYALYSHKFVNRLVPDINFEDEKTACELIIKLIEARLLNSARDLSGGGLALALIESCMMSARPIGATVEVFHQTFDSPNGPLPLRGVSRNARYSRQAMDGLPKH